MSYKQILLNDKTITIYSEKEWFDKFVKYCDKIYNKRGQLTGEYCCGYHWCCDKCETNLCCGCADCVQTIIDIAKTLDIYIDRSDLNFQKFEDYVRKSYERKL